MRPLLLLSTLPAAPFAFAQSCPPPSGIITALTANPKSIIPGQPSVVTWSWNSATCTTDASGTYNITTVNVVLQCGPTIVFSVPTPPNEPFITINLTNSAGGLTDCTWQLSIELPPTTTNLITLDSTNDVSVVNSAASSSVIPSSSAIPSSSSSLPSSSSSPSSVTTAAATAAIAARNTSNSAILFTSVTIVAPSSSLGNNNEFMPSSIPDSGPSTAVIVGTTMGGLAALSGFILFAFLIIRQRRRQRTDSLWDKAYSDDLEYSPPTNIPPAPRDYLYSPPRDEKNKKRPMVQRDESQRYPRASSMDITAYASGHVEDSPPNSQKQNTLGGTMGKYLLPPARESTPSILAYNTEPPENPAAKFKSEFIADKEALAKYHKVRDRPRYNARPPNSHR